MPSSDACRDVRAATRQADGIRGKIANDAVVLAAYLGLALTAATGTAANSGESATYSGKAPRGCRGAAPLFPALGE